MGGGKTGPGSLAVCETMHKLIEPDELHQAQGRRVSELYRDQFKQMLAELDFRV